MGLVDDIRRAWVRGERGNDNGRPGCIEATTVGSPGSEVVQKTAVWKMTPA